LKSTTVVDPETVKIELTEPIAAFVYDIAIPQAVILPKKEVEKEGSAFWKHPVGAGPFKFKEFEPGVQISFEPNPYYWEKDKPYLESVRFDFQPEGNSRLLSIESGKAQEADGVQYNQIPTIEGNSELELQLASIPAFLDLSLNNKVKPLGDVDVRNAIQYAINRELINASILKETGELPNSLLPPMKYYDHSLAPYEYNVGKAKELLAKAGYPNGFPLTLTYESGSETTKQLTLLIQQELGEIGIKVKLNETSLANVDEEWFNRSYDMLLPSSSVISDLPVPDEYAGWFADPTAPQYAFSTSFSDPTITKHVHTFQRTLSESERAKQWAQIQREFKEQSPAVNLMNTPNVTVHRVGVCGTSINSQGVNRLENTWLAKG
jgi:peptide/nickel transport system substrate-binding protein